MNDFVNEYWKESVYSDGSKRFVNPTEPAIGDEVTISIELLDGAPVNKIFLRYIKDGAQEFALMQPGEARNGLLRYSVKIKMTQKLLRYQFFLIGDNVIYYYTQRGLVSYIQDEVFDFVIKADYHQPAWVKDSVFYQIFPERFCNGNKENDVKNGEYSVDGFPTIHIDDWNAAPLTYEEGRCLDFYGGDLEGIKEKIPYLKELGVTALYLNPIFEADTVHKYDCKDYLKVDEHFGGDKALQELCEALHKEGMKIVIDISINHTGKTHRWFTEHQEYYCHDENGNYIGWRGVSELPQFDYHSQELRDAIYRNPDSVLKKWLKPPYCIDGWRFDVADVMGKYGNDQLDHELWHEIRKSIREENKDAYILAEEWGDASEYLQGEEWDSSMNYYGCARVLRPFIGLPDPYFDFGQELRHIRYHYKAKDVKERIESFLSHVPFALWQNQFNLIGSHDVNRVHNNDINMREYRGMVIFQFTQIGAPCVYYGDEALVDGIVGTNEGCRYPMPWGSGFENTENFRLYKKLAHLKKEHDALKDGGFKFVWAEDEVIAFARFDENEAFFTVMSTDDEDRIIELPVGIFGFKVEDVPMADVFGTVLELEKKNEGVVRVLVKAHESYLIQVK